MKFRTIFVIFNIVLIFSFLFIFFVPFFLFSLNESIQFWLQNWPFVVFFIVIISVFNIYFIKNWTIYTSLEKEQWDKLSELLQKQIYEYNNTAKRIIRLYVNSSLLSNKAQAVIDLEIYVREKKPSVLQKNAIYFIVTRMLTNDFEAASKLLDAIPNNYNGDFKDWLDFYRGFVCVMQKNYVKAVDPFKHSMKSRDPVIKLLTLYLLDNLCIPALNSGSETLTLHNEIKQTLTKLKTQLTAKRWSIETERAKNEIPAVIIANVIDEAGKWMFQTAE